MIFGVRCRLEAFGFIELEAKLPDAWYLELFNFLNVQDRIYSSQNWIADLE